MSKVETLFENKWVTVLEKETEKNGNYTYTHKPWCNGVAVAILPYKQKSVDDISILGRFEICPAHSDDTELCSITGGFDNKEIFTIYECVLNELMEEGGYKAEVEHLINLGTVRPSKSSDTLMYLFAINIDQEGIEECEATTDGTVGEIGAYCKWVDIEDAIECKDPLVSTMIIRMLTKAD